MSDKTQEPDDRGALGRRVGVGRSADVYDLGDGTVLRRYRRDHNGELEGRMMTWLFDRGVRVPRVHSAHGRQIVMDRITGPTMMDDLANRPWMLVAHARLLAHLQRQINELEAPAWFPTHDGVTSGTAVVHLDLHPMNVLMGREGPVVIDWTNASRGDASFDAAMTYVLGSTYETHDRLERIGSRAFVWCFSLFRGRQCVRRALRQAAKFRLRDPNVTAAERISLEKMLSTLRA